MFFLFLKKIIIQVINILSSIFALPLHKKIYMKNNSDKIFYDRTLFWLMIGLVFIGFIMVTSASMPIGQRLTGDPLLFFKRNCIYITLIFCVTLTILNFSMKFWQQNSSIMLAISVSMLLTVLIIGKPVNGASRWIEFWLLCFQPSEFTKLSLFCYFSNCLARKKRDIRQFSYRFLKPLIVIFILSVLLLAQPDFGTIFILFFTTLALIFLSGARLCNFLIIICISFFLIALMIFSAPYRILRITSFWNPWEDPFGKGYQLTQSLMAFGRGRLCGQGLGNSIQKFEYLPGAHTDFIFSIIGEELGYIGVVCILLMTLSISLRAMLIGRKALENNCKFSGFLSCSIGFWFSLQTTINVGVVAGTLPTKGLTFPLISYGGSSLLSMITAIIILLRVDYETRLEQAQAFIKGEE